MGHTRGVYCQARVGWLVSNIDGLTLCLLYETENYEKEFQQTPESASKTLKRAWPW